MILAALDYLPVNFSEYLYHLYLSISLYRPSIYAKKSDTHMILGYSCRSLFETIIMFYIQKNPDLKILTTPIHHSSFINIIEKYIKPNNLYIIDMNDNYNSIINITNYDIDLCIITHLFGQDINCKYIIDNKNKFKAETVFIEDRVQGGTFCKEFSNDFIDLSIYSCGMDKKPCGLGGGIVLIKENNSISHLTECLIPYLKIKISNYTSENFYNRFWFVLKKFPTLLLYNYKWFIKVLLNLISIFNIDLYKFLCNYRKNNPGFEHDNYNKNPSNGTLHSINYAIQRENYIKIENLYTHKSNIFFSKLTNNLITKMFKWNNNKTALLTPYNTISVSDTEQFIKYFINKNIPVIKNPTYKIFNFEHNDKDKYKNFNDSLVYLPSLAIMNIEEIENLAILINNYFDNNY